MERQEKGGSTYFFLALVTLAFLALGLHRIALLLGAVCAEGQIQHGGEEGQRHERQKEICASAFFLPFHG